MVVEKNDNFQSEEELELSELPEEIEEEYDESGNEITDWKNLALKNYGIAKRFKTKLEKMKQLEKEYEEFKKSKNESNNESKNEFNANSEKQEPNEPDYGRLAFLESKGISHVDDQKFVENEAKRLKLPLNEILALDYVQAKLKANKEQREAESGLPKDKGSSAGVVKDIDYWLNKGETPDDLELAEKVIEARIKREQNKNKFSNELF